MSVAFRRESDDEHLEPTFELPIPPGPNLVTPRGLALIEARAAKIEADLAGELTEEARKKLLRDARYWRHRTASAQLAPAPSGEEVAVGTRVTYSRDGSEKTITIVGHDESEPAAGRVGFTAPLVKAMLGATEGETVDGPGGPVTIERIEIAD
ncbi:transcription elongation factor GreA [Sphingomonas rosea]|uniref:Transcription elongation factor GreA n=1 Tax=Sphingomonas rosea TaxID=335605 RepID=A0ABP7UEH5_9SPHN